MKKILTLILFATMMLTTNGAFAQNNLVATLNHEGAISYFYGSNALVNAHEAATHGDVITLSVGTFNPTTITKAVTIYGSGMEFTIYEGQVTAISGDFSINITDEVDTPLLIQGIYSRSSITVTQVPDNSQLLKSRLSYVDVRDEITFIHCKITYSFSSESGQKNLYNCFMSQDGPMNNVQAYNCVVIYSHNSGYSNPYYANGTSNSSFYNCIICQKEDQSNRVFPSSNTIYNSVGIGNNYLFSSIIGIKNSYSNYESIFKEYSGTYSDTVSFELTDEAKTAYLGYDGTQIGVYGNSTPYDPRPTVPLITTYQVAPTAINGKVSVNIVINGGAE